MQKINYIAIKEDGKAFRVINSKLLKAECDGLLKGRYRLTVDKLRKEKSNPQLGYLFACVYPLSMQLLNDAGWEITSIDQCDAFWKDLYAKKEVINRHTGEIRMIPALKRDFMSIDMMNYIESIRQHCSEFLGGYIPGPEEQTNIEFNEQE